MNKESELKACPFCGEEGKIVKDRLGWRVMCSDPLHCGYGLTGQYTSEEAGIKKWNTRPREEALQKQLDDLRVQLKVAVEEINLTAYSKAYDMEGFVQSLDNDEEFYIKYSDLMNILRAHKLIEEE